MDKLEDLNGQQAAVDAVLAGRTRRKEAFTVVGPSGAGVSWTLQKCAQLWEEQGGAALEARGEESASDRALFPWLTMVLPGAKRLARIEVLKGGIAQGTRAVPLVGSMTSYIVEEVLNHRKRRLAREALFLTEQEQDLLFVIQTVARRKRLLLLIDNLEVWDEASWSLLSLIVSTQLDDLYPASKDAVLFVGAAREVNARLRRILADTPLTQLNIRLSNLDEMPLALSTFRFPALTGQDVEAIFGVTTGRLDLLHDLSAYIHETDVVSPSAVWPEFYSGLIKRRVQGLRARSKDLEDTLAAAAIIGETFTLNDLACLTGAATDDIHNTLRLATSERFLSSIDPVAQFESAELYRYFHRAGANEHSKYHAKFAECLRIMRPGDYGHRCRHLLLANNSDDALTCYALAVLAAKREYRPAPDPGDLRAAPGWTDIRRYLDVMLAACAAHDEQRISAGLTILESVDTFVPEVLIAERDYLQAVLLLTEPSVASYEQARQLLERWKILAGREGEIWGRMAQSLIVAQTQTGHLGDARRLEAALTADYWRRRHVDPWALHCLNVLRRRAECLHSLSTTRQRLESAIAYFGPAAGAGLPRQPIQYYYSLTNLIGNQVVSGSFEDALVQALLLEDLVRTVGSVHWPLPEIAANNVVLARYLSGNLEAKAAATMLSQIVTTDLAETGDRLLLHNNYAVFLALSGCTDEAHGILTKAHAAVATGSNSDGYHRYFIANNLAGLYAISGDRSGARSLLQECASVVDQFYPAIRPTMERRQELMCEAMGDLPRLTAQEFDTWLIDRYGIQIGPQWAFYGRGFLLTDIQFWSAG